MCHVSGVTCNLSHVTNASSHSPSPPNSPIIHSRLVHSRVFHSRVVPKTLKTFKTQKFIETKIVSTQAKICDTLCPEVFLTSGSGGFAMPQTNTHGHCDSMTELA